jgi:DNA repair exonuclease SbcCD ATPase subunit
MIKFALDKKRLSRDLFDPAKYLKKTTHLRDIIARLQNDLVTKQRTRKGLYRLLEMEGADLDELHSKLQENRDHILTMEANLKESQDRLIEFEESAKRENEIKEFLENNKSYLRQLRHDIRELPLSDRKLLVESMLNGPIEVSYQDDSELDGPGGFNAFFNLRYNPDIIQRFIEEGKIQQLRQNGRKPPCQLGPFSA